MNTSADVFVNPSLAPRTGAAISADGSRQRRFYISSLDGGYDRVLQNGFDYLGESGVIDRQDRVVIKPNLTFPTFRPGVMTNPEALEAVVRYIREFTDRITVCEADSGGYNPFSMTEVFRVTGIEEMARRLGVRLVNLSHEPARSIPVRAGKRVLQVPVPPLLLDETDLFISLPVPKVHLNTINSLAIKNQWGTIKLPEDRLKLHPYFKEVVYALNKIYPRSIAIVDGKYGLTRTGPLRGDVLNLNWMSLCDDPFLSDLIVTQLQGFHPADIEYLRWALEQEGLSSSTEFCCNVEWRDFRQTPFFLQRKWTDYPGLMAFRSRFCAHVAYRSILSKPLHWLLYHFREPFY
jgi:uncharacterized protein (DUF362 family)